jgi:Fic family protein
MSFYIHQRPNWPNFTWDNEMLLKLLGSVRHLQGKIVGKMEAVGFDVRNEASLDTLTLDILKTSEIEGEILDPAQVRSSLAKRLGLDIGGLISTDRNVDGVVDMLLDATQQAAQPLTEDRLFAWHSSLFPAGRSGLHKLLVGQWRKDSKGPMQVVSGSIGKENIHFEAPPAERVAAEMSTFLDWFNKELSLDPVMKAGIAHLWFITIHPFEDGNGRIARALTDLLLTRGDGMSQRFYSMSTQIRVERKGYYKILEKSQQGLLDISAWLEWFLTCLLNALLNAEFTLQKVLVKHQFWLAHKGITMNQRQIKTLHKLLDGFAGKLTTVKWAKINTCSRDTALRDLQDLINKGLIEKEAGGGRSSSYQIKT